MGADSGMPDFADTTRATGFEAAGKLRNAYGVGFCGASRIGV